MIDSYKARLRRVPNEILKVLPSRGLPWDNWEVSLRHPNFSYAQFDRFFAELPIEVRDHYAYYSQEGRGYGSNVLHAMWYVLHHRYRIENFLEIGVFRGKSLSLGALLQDLNGLEQDVTGISPLSDAGDSRSSYIKLDYEKDINANFAHFGLKSPKLVRAYSTDDIAKEQIRSRQWDCIYIDGNHDYDVVKEDFESCSPAVKVGGLLVFDDAGLYTRYRGYGHGFRGHPGPSKLVKEIRSGAYRRILQVDHNIVFERVF